MEKRLNVFFLYFRFIVFSIVTIPTGCQNNVQSIIVTIPTGCQNNVQSIIVTIPTGCQNNVQSIIVTIPTGCQNNVQSIISDHFQKISNKICTENIEIAGQKD